jgi:hypothetical protein
MTFDLRFFQNKQADTEGSQYRLVYFLKTIIQFYKSALHQRVFFLMLFANH